jgi:transcriptional regulator with XRE-family HTH domain
MELRKLALLRAIGRKELAIAASTSESAISRAIKGESQPSDVIANRLAKAANALCAELDLPEAFDITDFNASCVHARELPEDALFIVEDYWFGTMKLTAKRLIDKEPNDEDKNELEHLLKILFHKNDYTQQLKWHQYTISVDPSEDNR